MLYEDVDELKKEELRRRSFVRKKYGHLPVDDTIYEKEFMTRNDLQRYLSVGLWVLELLDMSRRAAGRTGPIRRILDFGCGYGRILRALRAAYPEASIVAADRVEEATRFCAERFGAEPLVTPDRVGDLELEGRFNFIFVGSVFTHLIEEDFVLLLRKLTDALVAGGVMIFTVAGRHVARLVIEGEDRGSVDGPELRAMLDACRSHGIGFGRSRRPRQVRREWGRSLVRPSWVVGQIEQLPHVRLVQYVERGHALRQDVVAVVRVRTPEAVREPRSGEGPRT